MPGSNPEFGEFLRSRRLRLDPAALGLPAARRRTAGLRREEVAARAGIGIDWYIRLEQGRAVSPSAATVEALAGALGLNATERAHLRALAGDAGAGQWVREQVPDGLRRIVLALDQPAYVSGRRWDVLCWNAAAADMLVDFAAVAPEDRNILLFMFTQPAARRCFGEGWGEEARRMVAQFRTTYDLWARDAAFAGLLARLQAGSTAFAELWAAHDIRNVALGRKTLHHPRKGARLYDYATFQANDDPALKLALYTLAEG